MRKITLLLLLVTASLTLSATSNHMTQESMEVIKQFIDGKYSGAIIIDREEESGNIEVEILHQSREKELLFDNTGKWLKTKWEVRKSELPKAVLNAIESSPFKSYSIDDIDYVESPDNAFYKVELEKWIGDREATLYITPEGKIL